MIFCLFYQVNLTGSGLLNRTGAEIGCQLDKKCKNVIFIIEKIKKYQKCPALHPGLRHDEDHGVFDGQGIEVAGYDANDVQTDQHMEASDVSKQGLQEGKYRSLL